MSRHRKSRHAPRRRLFVQIYVAFVLVALGCLLAAGITAWAVDDERGEVPEGLVAAARYFARDLPDDASRLEAELAAAGKELGLHLTVWDADRRPLARTGRELPPPPPGAKGAAWVHRPGLFGAAIELPDGRWLGGSDARRPRWQKLRSHLVVLLVLAGVVALGCYPVARRITRRLEELQRDVEAFGSGALDTRADIEGRDEVADLARSFNDTADRIESLVDAQKRVLMSASHELRSPLTRLRMAVELLDEPEGSPERRRILEGATGDIEELDDLIGDLLLATRLERGSEGGPVEEVDLTDVGREEAERVGATLATSARVTLTGEARLLRRLLRNLLENARRHGGGTAVELAIEAREGLVEVVVMDRGPGVPAAEAERIFEPFYRPAGHRETSDGGVGVGLSLVRHIARHHGGEARYQPREGGGSRFVVTLRGRDGPGSTSS